MSLKRHVTCTLAAGLLALSVVAPGFAQVEISEEAKKQFRIGVALLQDPGGARYEEAYTAFKSAYASSPSWKILSNLALCAMNLERDGEAIDAYERYLKEADALDPSERAQVERDLTVLRGSVVDVTLVVGPPESTVVDTRVTPTGKRVVNRYAPKGGVLQIGIRAGQHQIQVEYPGYQTATWEVDAVSGQPIEKSIELEEAVEATGGTGQPGGSTTSPGGQPGPDQPVATERPVPVSVWVSLAATGALGVAFGVLGGLSLSNKGDFDDAYEAGDLDEAQSLADSGETLNIVADVMLAGAVVGAGVTLVLFLTRPEEPVDGADTALSVAPVVGPGVGGLSLTGSF